MPRRVQDIVPSDRRGIRELSVEKERKSTSGDVRASKKSSSTASKSKSFDEKEPAREIPIHKSASKLEALDKAASTKEARETKEVKKHTSIMPPAQPRKTRRRRKAPWLIAISGVIVLIAIVAFVASTYFSHATFTIVPRDIPVNVNSTYIAQGTTATGALSYQVIPEQGKMSVDVPATDGPQISTKAQGKVTLYNAYSNQPQRLIAGSRIANDSGLIYRLTGSVVVPGSTTKSGSTVPGTITATVQADQAGDSYNLTKTSDVSDFKFVAYKGTPRYTTVYARIAGDITGGFAGRKKTISPTLLASTTALLKVQLATALEGKVAGAVPAGFITYPSAYTTSFGSPVITDSGANTATVSVTGTLYGIAFDKGLLISRLASAQAVGSFGDYGYTSPGIENLAFTISNPNDFHPDKKTTLIMKLKGDFKMVGIIPVDELKKKLAGVPLANTQAILKPYYGSVIESGSGELIPAWAKVPSDTSRITVNVQNQ